MTDGMKSGAGSNPFADEPSDENNSAGDSETTTHDSDETTQSGVDSESASRDTAEPTETGQREEELPYIFQRNGVKDNRRMVQYFLRRKTREVETDAQHAVEDELGTDVYLTDLREALVRVGAEHTDEVANELRDWGYRFKED